MIDRSEWKELFQKNGWLVGNRVEAPDTRPGVWVVLKRLLGNGKGPVISVEFKQGAQEIILNKRATNGNYVEWDEHFLTFFKYESIKSQRRWSDVKDARYVK